jgi:endonuclease/exonuclease/phosphatase family metal-dependent hydrolase
MRIATFNLENLFSRARALNQQDWKDGKSVLDEFNKLSQVLQKENYTAKDKLTILNSIETLGLTKDNESKFVILRRNRGHLLQRPRSGSPEVIANGRGDWVGWLELKREAVNEIATQMTAKVIQDVNADILGVVEAEDRIALKNFNDQLLKPLGANFSSIMLIDGNDQRGIDVGLMTKPGFTIESIVSHVDDMPDDKLNDNPIFSRDCPEYAVQVDGNTRVLILVNHFKSKGFGIPSESDARRKAQAQRVRDIYELRKSQGINMIAIVGDFNDTPDSDPLASLLSDGSDLRDIFEHPNFQSDGRPGTFGNGTASGKLDYLLLSPHLFDRVESGGVWRKGVWGGKNGDLFPHYPEMKKSIHAASDHAAVWADINL